MNPPNPAPKPVAYIVDDEPMLLDLNEDILRPLGFEVQRFRAAELALAAYRTASPRPLIIITDFAMHQMTGMDLIAACRELNPAQKIVLVSGTVDGSVFARADEKPDHFMPKPYTTEEFTETVQRLSGCSAG